MAVGRKYSRAEPLYERSLAKFETAFGPNDREVAITLSAYAAMLRKTGRTEEADKLETRAETIRAKRVEQSRCRFRAILRLENSAVECLVLANSSG